MAIRPNPRASKPRRGWIRAQTSGSAFQAFFFLGDFAAVAELVSDVIVGGRIERLSWMRMEEGRVHFNHGWNKDGLCLRVTNNLREGR